MQSFGSFSESNSSDRTLIADLSNAQSSLTQTYLAKLRMTAAALKGIAAEGFAAENGAISIAALLEAYRLYGQGEDLARTLRTICRTSLQLNAAETSSEGVRSAVMELLMRLEKAGSVLHSALERLALEDPDLGGSRELQLWLSVQREKRFGLPAEPAMNAFTREFASRVMSPIANMYAHLTSTMAIEVRGSDGLSSVQGVSSSLAALKNSDDPVLRRSTFVAMNAWLASHGASFLDVINANTGFRTLLADQLGENILESELRRERMKKEIYDAMFSSIETALPELRETVSLRQRAFGGGRMKIWNLLSSALNSLYERGRSLEETYRHLASAFKALDARFPEFLERAHACGWVDADQVSRKSGGAWSDDLPTAQVVRVVTKYLPTLSGEASFAHLIGAAYQMHVMHEEPMPARLYPISITEVMANFCETGLLSHFGSEAQREGDAAARWALEWHALRRITNCCLIIPARHRLLKGILEHRPRGALTLRGINELSSEAWEHYFGGTTDGADKYVWAYKPHFYRRNPVFYDWQYTLGFLLSEALMAQFRKTGASASGQNMREVYRESGVLSIELFGERHLGADLKSRDFWDTVIEEVLKPVERCRNEANLREKWTRAEARMHLSGS